MHCLFSPCIVSTPPSFVTGQSGPHPCNNQHRYRLYRSFWKALKELGLWRNTEYLSRKSQITHQDDPREIIPVCVVNVSKKRILIQCSDHYNKSVCIFQEVRRRYPNPKGIPYTDYIPSCGGIDI